MSRATGEKAEYVRRAIATDSTVAYCDMKHGTLVCGLPKGHEGNHRVAHQCHWPGCTVRVPPAAWGCRPHWYTLPQALRNKIWRAFQPGQEISKRASVDYVAVADEAQAWIAAHLRAQAPTS